MTSPLPSEFKRSLRATLRFAHASGAWIVAGEGPGDAHLASREPPAATPDATTAPPLAPPPSRRAPAERLEAVRAELGDCRRCRLSEGRNHLVFGVGNPDAELLFVGEAPGADEDRVGDPFVGRAGKLLDRMIQAIGLRREDVYIANVLKCRPPNNRDPGADEAATCSPFLWKQIDAIRPKVICALGAHAARNVLGVEGSMGQLRGRARSTRGWTVMATYHPAYLLRNPSAKRMAWQDLKELRHLLSRQSAAR